VFSLIITIISISLVAVLAVSGLYYGGSAYLESEKKNYASSVLSFMDTTSVALIQYELKFGVKTDTLSDLIDEGFLTDNRSIVMIDKLGITGYGISGDYWRFPSKFFDPANPDTSSNFQFEESEHDRVSGICDAFNELQGIETTPEEIMMYGGWLLDGIKQKYYCGRYTNGSGLIFHHFYWK